MNLGGSFVRNLVVSRAFIEVDKFTAIVWFAGEYRFFEVGLGSLQGPGLPEPFE